MTVKTKQLEAAVYVGTYGKYNSGSIAGKWLQLADYDSRDDFYKACEELHKDESDPEYMFQDWEGIPDYMIHENCIMPDYWDYIDVVNASYLDVDVFKAGSDLGIDYNNIEDAYSGEFDSDEDFAFEMADACGFEESSTWPQNCIDWERAARDLMYDYCESDGHYFSNY
jgi:antirestriction protein